MTKTKYSKKSTKKVSQSPLPTIDKAAGKEEAPRKIVLLARNPKQKAYLAGLLSFCTIATGSAGTGKTYLACGVGAKALQEGKVKKLVLARANVPTGRSLGAFKGTIQDKLEPWLMPMIENLKRFLGPAAYMKYVEDGVIEFQPLETIRGRSYYNAIVLIDEAQQLTKQELKAIVTRAGKNTRLFLMGDNSQRDVQVNGLGWLIKLANKYHLPVTLHEFTSDDVVRSELCKAFVKAFEQEEL